MHFLFKKQFKLYILYFQTFFKDLPGINQEFSQLKRTSDAPKAQVDNMATRLVDVDKKDVQVSSKYLLQKSFQIKKVIKHA